MKMEKICIELDKKEQEIIDWFEHIYDLSREEIVKMLINRFELKTKKK